MCEYDETAMHTMSHILAAAADTGSEYGVQIERPVTDKTER